MKAPFTYFGGKSSVAAWLCPQSVCGNYLEMIYVDIRSACLWHEPFGGSLAVLLARDRKQNKIYHEIVNDIDCLIINVWRALKFVPTDVAKLCADPNSQALYWQRICYLVKYKESLLDKIIKDDEYYDAKLAAYWLYYKGSEIGSLELDKIDIQKVHNSIGDNGLDIGRNQLISNNGIHSQYNKIIGRENKLIAWFNDIQASARLRRK